MHRNRSRHRVSVHRKAAEKQDEEVELSDTESEVSSASTMENENDDASSTSSEDSEHGDEAGPSEASHPEFAFKAKASRKKHKRYFDSYMTKTLRSVSETNSFSRNARVQLNSLLCHLATTISQKAIDLALFAKRRTISMGEMVTATEFVLSGNLLEMANELAREALVTYFHDQLPDARAISVSDLTNFEGILQKRNRGSPKKKTSSRQAKAGIIFSAALAERFIRNSGSCNLMVSSPCPIYLASVLEYFTAELLILACNEAVLENRVRLHVRDFVRGVKKDAEFNSVFTEQRLAFVSNTVTSYLAHNVINSTDKPFARNIIVLQATGDCVITARFTVEKHIRAIVERLSPGTKVSKQVITYVHQLMEQELLNTLRQATYVASHAKHSKLTAADIEIVKALRENRTPMLL